MTAMTWRCSRTYIFIHRRRHTEIIIVLYVESYELSNITIDAYLRQQTSHHHGTIDFIIFFSNFIPSKINQLYSQYRYIFKTITNYLQVFSKSRFHLLSDLRRLIHNNNMGFGDRDTIMVYFFISSKRPL